MSPRHPRSPFFFFNDTATTEIYPLSLHDALPICTATITDTHEAQARFDLATSQEIAAQSDLEIRKRTLQQIVGKFPERLAPLKPDRKSTRLNSSHTVISYAVLCLKKNNTPSSNDR